MFDYANCRTAELPNPLNKNSNNQSCSHTVVEFGSNLALWAPKVRIEGLLGYGLCKTFSESYLPTDSCRFLKPFQKNSMFGFRFFLNTFRGTVILGSMSGFYLTPLTQLQTWAQVPPEHRANGETFDLPQASINYHGDERMSYCLWLRYWMVIYEYIRGSPTQVGYVKVCMLYKNNIIFMLYI